VGVPRGNLSPEVDLKSSWRRAAPPEFRKERPRRVGSGEREEEADCRGGSARSERVESFFFFRERTRVERWAVGMASWVVVCFGFGLDQNMDVWHILMGFIVACG
jgi:hypothetical protein